jgi:glycosyltransferase involved in cell wall biosynthesis
MTLSNPFFSIIIPAYNRAYILPETIRSIQEQSFENWEVIVVDDGSKDNTREVVEQLSLEDNRIRYVYQQNAERSVARNNGADNALGNYLMFLDSDDKYAAGHLEKLHAFITAKHEPVAFFFSNLSYLHEHGIEVPEIPVMEKGKEFEYVLLQPITPSRVCIHKDIFKEFRFDPEIVIVEDLVLWVSIATKYPAFQLCESSLLYRIHEGNSVDLSRNSYLSRYKGLQRLFYHEKYANVSQKIPDTIKRHLLAECSFNMARHFEFVSNYRQMNAELLRSFKHSPSYRNKERLFMYLHNQTLGKHMLRLFGKGKTT